MVDDDELGFLEPIMETWKDSSYKQSFTLHTLILGQEINQDKDLITWISKLEPSVRERLVIFVDRNHSCFKPKALFERLKEHSITRYIPVAFMTAGEMQEKDVAEIIRAGAQRILYNKRSSLNFLYECASVLDQMRNGSENNKWNDLQSELTKDIEKPSYDSVGRPL
jgi:CheY-like chemotaxis protein